jgi:hypothetical protein
MTRTRKETAATIAKTIKAIRSNRNITSAIIKKECAKNGISEAAVKRIAIGNGTKITTLNKSDGDE